MPNYLSAIFLYSIDDGKRTQLTDGMSDARHPVLDKDGKYLYFTASTDDGPSLEPDVRSFTINGAPAIAGEIAFRFFPVNGVQKQFLYSNWSRLSNNGDAHIDYEFNQADPSTNPVPGCPQLPLRTEN